MSRKPLSKVALPRIARTIEQREAQLVRFAHLVRQSQRLPVRDAPRAADELRRILAQQSWWTLAGAVRPAVFVGPVGITVRIDPALPEVAGGAR